jgi:hypothetical protein
VFDDHGNGSRFFLPIMSNTKSSMKSLKKLVLKALSVVFHEKVSLTVLSIATVVGFEVAVITEDAQLFTSIMLSVTPWVFMPIIVGELTTKKK